MKREFLSELGLEKDIFDKIMDHNGKDIVTAKKAGAKSVSDQVKELNKLIKERDKQLMDLNDKADDNKKLKEKIAELIGTNQADREKHAVDLAQKDFDQALFNALSKSKAKDKNILMAMINKENLKLDDDGKVTGIDDQIKSFKQSHDYLFEADGGKTGDTNPANTGAKKDIDGALKSAMWGRNIPD
jgi:hypothetical protein